jgi:CHAD domain-containing protein
VIGSLGMDEFGAIEREVKLSVWPGYELPDLSGVNNGARVGVSEEQHLDAIYYDTPDLRLLRRGVTLRFRRGEQPGDVWTVKLPAGAPAVGLARREVTLPALGDSMPEPAADLVRGWALGAPLQPVAHLRTLRRRTTVSDGDQTLALLDDDEVSILRGSRVAARFRELEVELVDDAPEALLRRLARRLEAAGAQPVDQVPKLVRALGPAALAPWELTRPELRKRPSAAEVIQAGLADAAARFIDHHAAVILDEDPEGVHQARVGIRQLRSDLRTFSGLLKSRTLKSLRSELRWLADELGAVRDLDVLLAHLRSDARGLGPDDRPGAQELLARLADQRAEAYASLRAAMRSARYAALLEAVAKLVNAPPFASRDARRPASAVVPKLVRRPLRRLRRHARRLGKHPRDAELHRVRILAKRLRYATEVSAPFAGKRARRAARGLKRLQDVLGDHHDACEAVIRLRRLVGEQTPSGVWATGVLAGLQLARAADCRERFPAAYKAALANKRWTWIP